MYCLLSLSMESMHVNIQLQNFGQPWLSDIFAPFLQTLYYNYKRTVSNTATGINTSLQVP